MKKIIFVSLLALSGCAKSSSFDSQVISKDKYGTHTLSVSIFTPIHVDATAAKELYDDYAEPGETVTLFFYDDLSNINDTSYYAHTNGDYLYFRNQPVGVRIN